MANQGNEISKLCLAGFILSILPVLLFPLSVMFGSAVYFTFIIFPLAGFIVSIAGLVSVRKTGRSGKVLGILGIVFPSIEAALLSIIFVFLYAAGSENRALRKNEMYSMGGMYNASNTEYDVSQFRVPEGYDFNSLNITVSETEFKTYTTSKLQTISSESDMSVRGTYQDYDFLIVKSDRLDDWLAKNNARGFEYSNGNANIYHGEEGREWMVIMVSLAVYKDPSDKYIIITNCNDYKVITEFFN